jgi:DNA-binding transcriptional MerR regulator
MNQLLPAPILANKTSQQSYSVQETATRTGLSEHNLRYYERVGLLRPVERLPESGHRRYSEEDLEWIRFLVCLRETRMPIVQMKRYADLRERGLSTLEARRLMLEEHHAFVCAQIAELEQCRLLLEFKIDYYKLSEQSLEAGLPIPLYRAPRGK